MENEAKKTLELYIHVPFCVKKCDYCDFLSGPAGKERQREYFQALEREIAAVPDFSDREITTVFIGGGTPSVPDPSLVGEMLDQIRNKFFVAPDAEITIEANPGTLYKEKLQIYLEHGINRLSLGLQSPQNRELKILGRIHTWEEFQESFFMARDAGFSNINIDLMSAIPEQTYADWEKNLRTVAGLSPEHISAYSLIIEEGTPFGERKLKLPDEDTEYRMYENTAGILEEYGFHQYEISNYAKGGRECRHNKGYWQRIDYLGLGLGASSLLDHMRFSNTADIYVSGASDDRGRFNGSVCGIFRKKYGKRLRRGPEKTSGDRNAGTKRRQDISFEKGNPCEQWSDGGFSAVEKFVDFFTLTNECSGSILIKNQKFYSGIREVDSAVEKNTGVFFMTGQSRRLSCQQKQTIRSVLSGYAEPMRIILRILASIFPETSLWYLPDSAAPVSHLLHLIPFMQRDRDVIWSHFLPMRGSSWDRWRNRMWRVSRAFRRQSPLIRSQRTGIPVLQWVR